MKNNRALRIIYIILGSLLTLMILVFVIGNPSQPESQTTNTGLDKSNIYVIAKQFAKAHLGDADYGFGEDGFEDMGDGEYYVTGTADFPGRRVRWTVELKYNGGEWQYKDNWTEKSWHAQ